MRRLPVQRQRRRFRHAFQIDECVQIETSASQLDEDIRASGEYPGPFAMLLEHGYRFV